MSYETIKALHIISVICWMAGMLYLPRIFVYHCQVKAGSEASEIFKVMERKLLRLIINPSMIATWVFGLWLAIEYDVYKQGWFHAKVSLLVVMQISHAMMARSRRQFAEDKNQKSEKFFRFFNEVPAVLMIGIVLLAVLKPF